MKIGVYSIGSQSGLAYFADLTSQGYTVVGFARQSTHGTIMADTVREQGGVWLERPVNSNNEPSRFVELGNSIVTQNLADFTGCLFIILAIPSHYHVEVAAELKAAGILNSNIPLILSPSRTFASPYLWKKLGDRYPIVCFSTSPYSSKIIKDGTVYIKRRKRTWLASLEGNFDPEQVLQLGRLFPQAAHCRIPALTSLNNIGAVFHPAAYLLNMEAIEQAAKDNNPFSFYMEGIFYNSEVASTLEQIDQVRLQIAQRLGMNVFGLAENPRDDVWRKLITGMRALEEEHEDEILELREIRKLFIKFLNNSVLSAQHWLDITYGVTRVQGESLGSAIGRTPTYQNMSVPQIRYMEEDIPTGLVPLEAIAIRLGIDASPLTTIIDKYNNIQGGEARASGRGLREFSSDFIRDYLLGS